MSKGHGGFKGARLMTPSAASRIQSAVARAQGGKIQSGTFAPRAQSTAAHHVAVGRLNPSGQPWNGASR